MHIRKRIGYVIKESEVIKKQKKASFSNNDILRYKIVFKYQVLHGLFDQCGYSLGKMLYSTAEDTKKEFDNQQDHWSTNRETQKQIEGLWSEAREEYVGLATMQFLENYYRTAYGVQGYRGDATEFPTLPIDLVEKAYVEFNSMKLPFIEKIVSLVDENDGDENIRAKVRKAFDSQIKLLDDTLHLFSVDAVLQALKNQKLENYRFISNGDENTCKRCAENNSKVFAINTIQEGVNYPLMHPNCRCSIEYTFQSVTKPEKDKKSLVDYISTILDLYDSNIQPVIDYVDGLWYETNKVEALAAMFNAYFSTYQTIEVGGSEYRIDKANFNGIAILPNGEFAVPENVTPMDRELLDLMKLRDSLDNTDPEKINVIQTLCERAFNNPGKYSVDVNKPYSFYELGEDVTERLNAYMKSNEEPYAEMHNQVSWLLNLRGFYNLMHNSSEMDLKNQPEWQKSAYILDGEIVSQDVLGNINYGYFGKYCGFPDSVLALGAGYAQILDGTADPSYYLAFGDDPRDGVRINHGIDLYKKQHPEEF